MPKFLGNRVGYATSTSSDGGVFNLHSQQIFLRVLEKWPPLKTISSTGATVTSVAPTRQRYHVFTGSGSFSVSNGSGIVHYTIVAGGGGGGTGESRYSFTAAGGGGGGGIRSGSAFLGPGNYTVTIGAGGVGGAAPPYSLNATNGSPSKIEGPSNFPRIESTGGGYGGTYFPTLVGAGSPGGCGGGGAAPNYRNVPTNYGRGGDGNTPSFSPPQGTPGGTSSDVGGGGGGGASGSGGTAKPSDVTVTLDNDGSGGDGGFGRDWAVIVEDQFSGLTIGPFGGGGGGGGGYVHPVRSTTHPNGGSGTHGGGDGGSGHYPIPNTSPQKWGEPGTSGAANKGGGGGGGSASQSNTSLSNFLGGSGGSGIIIISHSY